MFTGQSLFWSSTSVWVAWPRAFKFDLRFGSKTDVAPTLLDVRFVPTADVRRGLPDFRQVDPELSSLLEGLHPLLLADCWQPLQAGSQQSTPRA